jgi:hypothetical protein
MRLKHNIISPSWMSLASSLGRFIRVNTLSYLALGYRVYSLFNRNMYLGHIGLLKPWSCPPGRD